MDKAASDWPSLLHTWAALGAELQATRSRHLPDWSAVNEMIKAVQPLMKANAEKLKDLLERSRKKLKPLGEPFDLDLGLHRWLDAEREEAYSDWLEWVVGQAKTAARVFGLFRLNPPDGVSRDAELQTKREVCVTQGHEGQAGRLDLVVYHGHQPVLVVEVKKGDADEADTAKNAGYTKTHPNAKRVLLVVAAEEEDYEGFKPCKWADVCTQLRRLAVSLHQDHSMMAAAMVLAFVAAVEQNLLGFVGFREGNVGFVSPRLVKHIENFLKPEE